MSERTLKAVPDKENVKENVSDTEESNAKLPDHQFAFCVIKDNQGTLGIRSMIEGESLSTENIYSACDTICRNIRAQDIAQAVAATMVQAVDGLNSAGRTQGGLVVPEDLRKK